MNKKKIKINHLGRIVKGLYKDWYVLIEDDSNNTGGYLILIFNHPDSKTATSGFDDWVEGYVSLESYFIESDWSIEWIDSHK